ncbi:hypothetical protein [Vibrio parahaemolyticus]|uniref:hypothetical protein n=1 Tax=Vibrio parahaemolyticus TaxID=670 RepID=UPI0021538266|nr:hypothetical protein [Vibrio parahaemolyticus]
MYFLILFAMLLGHVNREREVEKISNEIYGLQLYTWITLIYYVYLIILAKYTSVEGNPFFMVVPTLLTLAVVSYYWTRFKDARDAIVDSFLFKVGSFFALVVCNIASIYMSAYVIEVLTGTTATDLQHYVDMARWVYFIMLMLLVAQIIFGLSLLGAMLFPLVKQPDEQNVLSYTLMPLVSLYILNLAFFGLLVKYSLDESYISEYLYVAFHNNLSGEQKLCANLDESVKLTLIGNKQALVASKNDEVTFSKVDCE